MLEILIQVERRYAIMFRVNVFQGFAYRTYSFMYVCIHMIDRCILVDGRNKNILATFCLTVLTERIIRKNNVKI